MLSTSELIAIAANLVAAALLLSLAGKWLMEKKGIDEKIENWWHAWRTYRGGRHAGRTPAPGGASYLRRLISTSTAEQRHRALDREAAYVAPHRIHIESIVLDQDEAKQQ